MGDQEIENLGLRTPEIATLTADFQRRIVATMLDYRNALYANMLVQMGTSAVDARKQVDFNGAFLNHIFALLEPRLEHWRNWREAGLDAEDIWEVINDSPGG
jgi:hypothetical protein